MFNNRMLAVAAVLALAVPALGAAAPIVLAEPAYEQLVEGHTVFTVIEAFRNQTEASAEFAAAVAVLVREYDAELQNVRFPGVLWFNDQYLTNPNDQKNAAANFRYPCGGSVLAVNAGQPDPRVVLANVGSSSTTEDAVFGMDYGDNTNEYNSAYAAPDGTPANDADDANSAWINVTNDQATPTASSDIPTGLADPDAFTARSDAPDVFAYNESYLVTDPNDHVWIVDKYIFYASTIGTSNLGGITNTGTTVWVVNILGSPVFIPDDGYASCGPYNDIVSEVYNTATGSYTTGSGVDDAVAPGWDATIGSTFPYRDNPPMGYAEPSRNGYCYNGNPQPCATTAPTQPIRLYNALLYMKLADLTVAGDARSHDATSTDTNGCQVGTEWACPNGDDNQEGNSHPFHPTPGATTGEGSRNPPNPPHTDVGDCPALMNDGTEETNHGGSTDLRYPYCDNLHATRNIDIYFSASARPFPPVVRNWALYDTAGSTAPFHDETHHNTATTTP